MKLSRRAVVKGALALGAVGCASTKEAGGPAVAPSGGPAPRPAPGSSRRILILGGTGFLGPQLVEAALARGHSVTLFNRGRTRPHLFPNLEKLRGDRQTGDLKALEGRSWDAVIDTSGYVPRIVRASAELRAPNVGPLRLHLHHLRLQGAAPGPAWTRARPWPRCRTPTTRTSASTTVPSGPVRAGRGGRLPRAHHQHPPGPARGAG
jgi:hypothetical protein